MKDEAGEGGEEEMEEQEDEYQCVVYFWEVWRMFDIVHMKLLL